MARSARLESGFQDRLIKRIKALLPGCFVFKMDQVQGIPDLLILFGGRWASLECKQRRCVPLPHYADRGAEQGYQSPVPGAVQNGEPAHHVGAAECRGGQLLPRNIQHSERHGAGIQLFEVPTAGR